MAPLLWYSSYIETIKGAILLIESRLYFTNAHWPWLLSIAVYRTSLSLRLYQSTVNRDASARDGMFSIWQLCRNCTVFEKVLPKKVDEYADLFGKCPIQGVKYARKRKIRYYSTPKNSIITRTFFISGILDIAQIWYSNCGEGNMTKENSSRSFSVNKFLK